MPRVLRLDARDNVLIALEELRAGDTVSADGVTLTLPAAVSAKHKLVTEARAVGDAVIMYGVLVGRATRPIPAGGAVSTANVKHDSAAFTSTRHPQPWTAPDVSRWRERTFLGYHRADGRVGTRNIWLVVPLVFCENRNVAMLRQAFEEELGYAQPSQYRRRVAQLAAAYRAESAQPAELAARPRPFAHVDGIRFLTHTGGCGGTRDDAQALCGLLAGYITHPNVAGATVLSLGCQNAQIGLLQQEIQRRDARFSKPLIVLEQQRVGTEAVLMERAIRETFAGLVEADACRRQPAPLNALSLGLKCGGSDGFSGISANPAIGHTADLLAALGGTGILAEFPELCGVEQNLVDRCLHQADAERFVELMRAYATRARAVGSSLDMNPSPGNIHDGLITDAMKSAGAARKGGRGPVAAVLDFPERATSSGLNLLCTPGNDVECVTAQVAAGANVVLFTTGLGTPTGNPIAPVVKLATNSALAERMPDIIDIDTGAIIAGETTVDAMGERILDQLIDFASGSAPVKAEILGQYDFIPWKRGISL
jgi:altronate hydrolase